MSEQVNKNVPAIRFKGFESPWRKSNLEEIAVVHSGRDYKHLSKGDIPVYGTGGYMLSVNQALSNEDAIGIGRKGTINKPYILKAPFWTVDTLFYVTPSYEHDLNFIYCQFQRTNWSEKDESTGVPSLSKSTIEKTDFFVSKTAEQQKLGNFFEQIDTRLEHHQAKLDKLNNLKQAMLQKMFPQNGATEPEIRFKGFAGEWRLAKLEELFTERVERSAEGELISVTLNRGVIKASETGRRDTSSQDKSNYKKVEVGDIAYNSMRMWQGASGYSHYQGILSPAYTVIVPKKDINSLFFSYMFKKQDMLRVFTLSSQGLTSDTWNLKFPEFSQIRVRFPSEKEQQKIANYFRKLDQLITLQTTQLKKLRQIKQSCLAGMFV